MAKGLKVSKKTFMVGLVVLVVVIAFVMFSGREGFQAGGVSGAINAVGNTATQVAGNTVGALGQVTAGVTSGIGGALNAVGGELGNIANASYGAAAKAGSAKNS